MKDYRYTFLFLCGVSVLGNYFVLDTPAVVKTQLINRLDENYSDQQVQFYYSLLYTVYNLPNMILPLFTGFLIDYYGDQIMAFIFVCFIVIGQLLFCFGTYYNNVFIMIIARFLQGAGGESQFTALQILTMKWFTGKNLTFAYGCILANYRLASILNAMVSPKLSKEYGLIISFDFGAVVCCFSMAAIIGIVYLDFKYKQQKKQEQQVKFNQVLNFWKTQSQLYKSLCAYTGIIYSSHMTFVMFIGGILVQDFFPHTNSIQRNQELAGQLITIPFIIPTIFSPFFGMFIDKFGCRIHCLNLASLFMIIGYLFILYKMPLISMILFGFSLCIFSTIIWSSCGFLVNQKQLGLGFGIKICFQSLCCGILPILIVPLKNYYNSNYLLIYQLIFHTSLSFFFVQRIYYYDSLQKVSLNSPDQIGLLKQINEQTKQLNKEIEEEEESLCKKDFENI